MSNSKINVRTEKGELRWCFILPPGKKNNLNGENEYTASVVMSAEDAQPTIDLLDTLWEENKPKGHSKPPKSMGYKIDDESGEVSFNFKTKTTYPSGDEKSIRIFNSKAEQIRLPKDKKVGNGSQGRLSGVAAVYDAGPAARGVTLYLDAVQLTKFVAFSGGGPDFEIDEDGDFDGLDEMPFQPEELT